MKYIKLNEEEFKEYQYYLYESLVSRQLDRVFDRLANYLGITREEIISKYHASIERNGMASNGFMAKGAILKTIVDDIRNIKVGGKVLSKFDSFSRIMKSWGYQIKNLSDEYIFFTPIYNVKYDDDGVNKVYKEIIKDAAKKGKFYHISMVPPSKLGDLRPKGGDYTKDFETHENAVYMINSYLGNVLEDGDNFGEFSDLVNMAYLLVNDHYGRYPERYKNYIRGEEMEYTEEYMDFRRSFLDLEDESGSEEIDVLPVFIYELDINDQFLKDRPWKLYLDSSAGGGACYVKHSIPKSKITPVFGLLYNVYDNERFIKVKQIEPEEFENY